MGKPIASRRRRAMTLRVKFGSTANVLFDL
jgi:hypothetical protein